MKPSMKTLLHQKLFQKEVYHLLEQVYIYPLIITAIQFNFREDLIFALFAMSFESQIIEYAEIIFCIIFY